MTRSRHEEFLSAEDLDLATCSEAELFAWWDLWLRLAQASNALDEDEYSHGVFRRAPRAGCGEER